MSLYQVPLGFDLDGTLLDTWPRQLNLLDTCAGNAGLGPLDLEAVKASKRQGESTRDILEKLFGTSAEIDSICSEWLRNIESDEWLQHDRLLPGAIDTLAILREEGAIVSLITARQRSGAVAQQLVDLGLRPFVANIYVVSPFDAPQQKSRVLPTFGARAYVGDTTSDALACHNAGLPFFAVATGQHSPRLLRHWGVANVTAGLTEVLSELRSFFST